MEYAPALRYVPQAPLNSESGSAPADGFEQPAIVEPIDPFERGEFNCLHRSPRPASPDHLGFEEPLMLSASALSRVSMTLPTDGSMPPSAKCSPYLIERYWLPRSE